MAFSKDNLKGFVLALLSSFFIGSSFIIKKKGLRRAAAASGVRAGVGGFTYLLEPLWWVGMAIMIVGEVANFVAYAFAPAVLVTPLGALSIIVSAVLAHSILHEKLPQLGILGCVMCIAGSIIIVIHAPQESPITSVQEIWSLATQPAICVIMQMNYLNKALDTFNTAVVSPIYYVMFTSLTILASVIMFKDWDGQTAASIISEICGFVVVLSGTILLHTTKDFERSPSFRGGYSSLTPGLSPITPTLSTRLCSGNGELLKHDQDVPSEDFCRQEMY
ncbi:putative magnesium transporter [Citrus sinensis]|nr:putative magnesium transporter [Citrus sinensis]